jgi:broad specificity phosphatase PhoE
MSSEFRSCRWAAIGWSDFDVTQRESPVPMEPAPADADYGRTMLALLSSLHQVPGSGRARRSVLAFIRHSARHYGQAENDLDNPLSELGRALCHRFGGALPAWGEFSTRSSMSGRCIETAELIGTSHGRPRALPHQVTEELSAFYVRDMRRVGGMMKHLTPQETLRRWFAGDVPPEIMAPPREAAARLMAAITDRLAAAPSDHLMLCVSHDWSIYLLRHVVLGLRYGEHPPAEYLDGLAFWLDDDSLMVSSAVCGERRVPEVR